MYGVFVVYVLLGLGDLGDYALEIIRLLVYLLEQQVKAFLQVFELLRALINTFLQNESAMVAHGSTGLGAIYFVAVLACVVKHEQSFKIQS